MDLTFFVLPIALVKAIKEMYREDLKSIHYFHKATKLMYKYYESELFSYRATCM